MAPRIAQGILEAAKDVFNLDAVSGDQNGRLRPGQIRQVIAGAGAPHGRSLRETEMVEVVWTVDAGEEDLEMLREHDSAALRRVRILRLVDEALDQGSEPTQEDLGKALGVTDRTIRSDVATLEAEGYRVATRGKRRGVGRGQTHKVIIVDDETVILGSCAGVTLVKTDTMVKTDIINARIHVFIFIWSSPFQE